jgi:hypothetical protein
MIDERQRFDDAIQRFAPSQGAFERLMQRRTRRVRRQRLAAFAVACAVATMAFAFGADILRSQSEPAVTPSPSVPTPHHSKIPHVPTVQLPMKVGGKGVFVPHGATEMAVGRRGDVFVVNDRICLWPGEDHLECLTSPSLRATQPSFAPDGSRIAFAVRGSGGGVYVVDPRAQNRLTRLTRSHRDTDPNWSLDGTQLVFNRGPDLYTIRVGGGQPQLLVTNAIAPLWTERGIVFVHAHHSWAVATPGGRPYRLVFG